jgi:competence protein CoiA
MKFALVNGQKTEATKGARGVCRSCGSEMIAHCGEIKVHHWKHKVKRECDIWWENETEWHRSWKNQFPIEWQEIVHFDEKGEKHIADVKTNKEWVIEFQHSFIKPEERASRNAFYQKLVWVVDGLRRKTDIVQLNNVLQESSKAPVGGINIRQVNFPEESRLLREWINPKVPVFFDFQEMSKSNLWFLLPFSNKDEALLLPFSREEFIKVHLNEGFDELVNELIPNIKKMIDGYKRKASNRSSNSFLLKPRRRPRRRRF